MAMAPGSALAEAQRRRVDHRGLADADHRVAVQPGRLRRGLADRLRADGGRLDVPGGGSRLDVRGQRGTTRRKRLARLRREAHSGQDPQAVHAVLPGDLLALGARAAVVADRHLEGPDAEPQQPRGQLRVHAEAAGVQAYRPYQWQRYQL